MANPTPHKRKLNKRETKALIPILKGFNKMAKVLLHSLEQKISRDSKEIHHIQIMIDGMKIPTKNREIHTINVQTIDLGKTNINQKGHGRKNQVMEWEKLMRSKNKGLLL